MIYFDNSATTLRKPDEVGDAVKYAINNFGNASRSFYHNALLASREIYKTREEIASLVGTPDPLRVAFTSSATESLNLVIRSLIKENDHVITTVLEHNSVLRPLYLSGCQLDFLGCDHQGILNVESLESKIKPQTRFVVCTHGSNVTGNVNNVRRIKEICSSHNIILILDVSQTLGSVCVKADMADVLCFTGHKALFGPQGTGGIIAEKDLSFEIVKSGGAGTDSFAKTQINEMPDSFEAGTLNSHCLYGLQKGVAYINKIGLENIKQKEQRLLARFYKNIKNIKSIKIYGDFKCFDRLPIVALTIEGKSSSEIASILWDRYNIATRSGAHCAPLLHEHFGTVACGMVRFSFSYFNTETEIDVGVEALREIVDSN